MPKGTRKDGTSTGNPAIHKDAPRIKKGDPTRFGPCELAGIPGLQQEILDLYMFQGWSAPRIARWYNDRGEPRVKPHTVWELNRRINRRIQKAIRVGREQLS